MRIVAHRLGADYHEANYHEANYHEADYYETVERPAQGQFSHRAEGSSRAGYKTVQNQFNRIQKFFFDSFSSIS